MKKIDKSFGECVELEESGVDVLVAPGLGMSVVRFSIEGESILDLTREQVFLEYRKGLGPIILPFFSQRAEFPDLDYDRFPHIQHLLLSNVKDPFQHGLGRYASWSYEQNNNQVIGFLKSDDRLHDYTLRELAGFDFTASLTYSLREGSLEIAFDLVADHPVATGIHYYYDLKNRNTASVMIPQDDLTTTVLFDRALDDVFIPSTNSEEVTYTLQTETYILNTRVKTVGPPAETFDSVVIFSPENENFVCIEPISYVVRSENHKRTNRGKILLTPISKK